jgi:nitrate/nitrite transporter NarK
MDAERSRYVLSWGVLFTVVSWILFYTVLYMTPFGSFVGLSFFLGIVAMMMTIPTVLLGACCVIDWIENKN